MILFDQLLSEPVYNTRVVVQRTGVPADTFRAWERRYGVPRPSRTPGNQRLYSERDVATIAWLRDQTHSGLTISQAVALLRSEGHANAPSAAPDLGRTEPTSGARNARLQAIRQEVVDALVSFDAARADRVVEEAIALMPLEVICLDVLQPAMEEIGLLWERGEVGVSAEHHASGFVIRKIGALFNLSRPDVGRGPLVAACLEGELHEIGLLLTSLFLSRRGYQIVYLGANLPLSDLAETVRRMRPPLVLLSTSTREGAERLIASGDQLQKQLQERGGHERVPVIGYGGHVFLHSPDLRERTTGIFLGRNAEEAIGAVARVLAHPRR